MPLSTSSFNQRVPSVSWGKIWLLTIVVMIVIIVSFELLYRYVGHIPGIYRENPGHWARVRRKIKKNNKNQVVLIGASRMHLDVDPDIFEKAIDSKYEVYQMSVSGADEIPLLEHFAEDPTFQGILVFSYLAHHTPRKKFIKKKHIKRSEDAIKEYQSVNLSHRVDSLIKDLLSSVLICPGSYENNLAPLIREFVSNFNIPRIDNRRYYVKKNRWVAGDFSTSEWAIKRRKQKYDEYKPENIIKDDEINDYIQTVSKNINKLVSRGGKVVIVRLPSFGFFREKERYLYPKERVWKSLVQKVNAITIHFEDYESLKKAGMGDCSHLDMTDVNSFSKKLGEIVNQKLSTLP